MDLYVRESGPPGTPTIVWLHAGGLGGWMWEPQIADLQRDYHCLAPDLPEQGQSAQVAPFTMQGAAAQIAQLIRERAHGGRAHVVGLSLGAQVTVQLLAQAPEVVDHAIASAALLVRLPGRSALPLLIRLNAPLLGLDWILRVQARNAGVPEAYYPRFAAASRRLTPEALVHIYEANMGFLPAGLEGVRAPVLAVCGGREPGIMRRSVCRLARAIPTARAYVATGLLHTWNLQDPALFNATVRAWISDLPLPSALRPVAC